MVQTLCYLLEGMLKVYVSGQGQAGNIAMSTTPTNASNTLNPLSSKAVSSPTNNNSKSTHASVGSPHAKSNAATRNMVASNMPSPIVSNQTTHLNSSAGISNNINAVNNGGNVNNSNNENSLIIIERMFLYCLMWAFCGSLSCEAKQVIDHKKVFSIYFKGLVSKVLKFPDNGLITDFFIDPYSGDITPWSSKLSVGTVNSPSSKLSSPILVNPSSLSSYFVPTVDTIRTRNLLDLLIRNNRPAMLVGSTGTGKTMIINDYLSILTARDDSYKFVNINMNFYTDSFALQHQLEQNIDKRSGKTYGPSAGNKLIYFIDDLNLPQVETYGTQTCLTLIRQHLDHKSWYDRSDMSLKKYIVDCQYLTSMNHKNGSFTIDSRLQRHFATFSCSNPTESDLNTIFNTILLSHIQQNDFKKKIQNMSGKLIESLIQLHKEISNKFLPSAVKFHYNFTMRDLSSIVRGICQSTPTDYSSPRSMLRLWYHEIIRVYSDRLINEHEVLRCRDIVVSIGKKYFNDEDLDKCFNEPCNFTHFISPSFSVKSNTPISSNVKNSATINNASILNSNIINTSSNSINLMSNASSAHSLTLDDIGILYNYTVCENVNVLKQQLELKLAQYNESHTIMDLVLFDQAIKHILRIARILMIPNGNALLIGVGGSGKQSLSKLACYICQYDILQIFVSSEYTISDFKENLRDMYRKTGIKPGLPCSFLLTDLQIVDERYLLI